MNLKKQKLKIIQKIHSLDNVIRGSIFEMKRFCGKKNCRCAKAKTPHKSMFLSFKYQGKTQMVPIKKNQIPQLKMRIQDYKELKEAIDELARINAEMLRSEK